MPSGLGGFAQRQRSPWPTSRLDLHLQHNAPQVDRLPRGRTRVKQTLLGSRRRCVAVTGATSAIGSNSGSAGAGPDAVAAASRPLNTPGLAPLLPPQGDRLLEAIATNKQQTQAFAVLRSGFVAVHHRQ